MGAFLRRHAGVIQSALYVIILLLLIVFFARQSMRLPVFLPG